MEKRLLNFDERKSLLEMAMSLFDYRMRVFSLSEQIAENFCLICYAIKYGKYVSHWENELKGHLSSIRKLKVKSGNKKKALYKELYDKCELNDPDLIYDLIVHKFKSENIELEKVFCQHFCDCLPMLIDCLAEKITIEKFFKICF